MSEFDICQGTSTFPQLRDTQNPVLSQRCPGSGECCGFTECLPVWQAAPAEVLIRYIPEGYKRAYLEFSKKVDDSVRARDLPQELRPRNVE